MIKITQLTRIKTGGGLMRVPGKSSVRWSGARIPPESVLPFDAIPEGREGVVLVFGDIDLMRGPAPVPIRSGGLRTFARLTSGPLEVCNPSSRPVRVLLATIPCTEGELACDQIVDLETVDIIGLSEERIAAQLLHRGVDYSTAVGIVPPLGAQRHHRHHRRNGAPEWIVVFEGSFLVKGAEEHGELSAKDAPVLVEVPSGTPASFVNTSSDTALRFWALYVPPFEGDEIEWLD